MERNRQIVRKRKPKKLKEIQKEIENNSTTNFKEKYHKFLYIIGFIIITIFLIISLLKNNLFISQNKFHNVNIELGTKTLSLTDFLNKGTLLEKSTFVTNINAIDLTKLGTYTVGLKYNDLFQAVILNIVDTTPPILEVQNLTISDLEKIASVSQFILKKEDNSGVVDITMSEIDYQEEIQEVTIVAVDPSGNKTKKNVTLTINFDKKAPIFIGLTPLTIEKNTIVDYKKGVKATDNRDGTVKFTVDDTKVNLNIPGTYDAIYMAQDKSGNKITAKRKIIVLEEFSENDLLVQKIAAKLSNAPEELRDYCRNNIKYNSNAGGDDPLYYGLTKWKGNCLVHAYCFKALLDAKQIDNQLIWVTDKTHYWNLVKINGVWRHMDATPSTKHGKYSIMTDTMRLETLSGRDWDHSNWPAAE